MTSLRIADVRLSSVTVSPRTTWDFIEIRTDDGSVGVGEWSDAGPVELARPLAERFRSRWINQPAEPVHHEVTRLLDATARDTSRSASARRLMLTVLGGFDAALCDVLARAEGRSMAVSLGVPANAGGIACYANINRAVTTRTEAECRRVAADAVAAGFTAVKFAPFDLLVGSRRITAGLRLAEAVRDAVGPSVALMLDLHGKLDVAEILAVAGPLLDLRPRWLEDVADPHDTKALATIRSELGVPLAGGEFAATETDLAPALDAGLLDVVMPDVKHAGGPRRALELGRSFAARGVEVSLHSPSGPVAQRHSALVSAGIPGTELLEYAFGEDPGRANLILPPEPLANGWLARDFTGAGIGVDLASALVRNG
nr:enolase C-terminal domain-like protein [Kibdelosporangium sp. MJ126-NF4]CEL18118.1 Mandelate racemase/muconate lactonizing enzyme-like protein [Kibdelosporangium sp. MJ126-NF4]CTQ90653.1 Mandelate racemase/muconate lactonizing enzyme-like protein [Kibdelosporangium sp. MJ126-NF4]